MYPYIALWHYYSRVSNNRNNNNNNTNSINNLRLSTIKINKNTVYLGQQL